MNGKPGVMAVMDRCSAVLALDGNDVSHEMLLEARATVERLAEAAANMEAVIWLWRETGQAPDFAPLTTADDALRAALAAFRGEA